MNYDLGDVVPLSIQIADSTGTLANATAVVLTVYKPDGTTETPTVVNASTGIYNCDYTPSIVGSYRLRWVATGTNAGAQVDQFTVRDFSKMGIVSLEDVKRHLNILDSEADYDDELQRMIDVATDMAENFTGIILGRQTFTNELYDGGDTFLKIQNPLAISITSVAENGITLDPSLYKLDRSGQRILRVGTGLGWATSQYGYWGNGVNNISVTYVAGFITPPFDAQQGVLEIIRHLWQTQRGAMFQGGGNLPEDSMNNPYAYSMPLRAEMLLNHIALPGMA